MVYQSALSLEAVATTLLANLTNCKRIKKRKEKKTPKNGRLQRQNVFLCKSLQVRLSVTAPEGVKCKILPFFF